MLVYTVGAECLNYREHVVRSPSDDERQQNSAQGLGRLLLLTPLLAPLSRSHRAAPLRCPRRYPRLHSQHHRLGGLRQAASYQRKQRRRTGSVSGARHDRRWRTRFPVELSGRQRDCVTRHAPLKFAACALGDLVRGGRRPTRRPHI